MSSLIVKKTTELTSDDIDQINQLYIAVFDHSRTEEEFKSQYVNTPYGYSYHALLKEGDELIGFHSGIPFYYYNGGQRFVAGLGINTMIAVGHRDFFNVRDLFMACENSMKEEGCVLRLGFPNDNSYPVLKKGFKYKDIGKLDTFFLPIRIGGIKPSLRILNPLSRLFSWGVILLSRLSCNEKICEFQYHKDRDDFDNYRYKWFDGYQIVERGNAKAHYRVSNHEGVRTAFVLDVYPRSKKIFDAMVREIYRRESKKIDLIMYVGHLTFHPNSLIKMPHKIEPKHFNFTCKPLVKDLFDESLYNIDNWDVNLSNYDLI